MLYLPRHINFRMNPYINTDMLQCFGVEFDQHQRLLVVEWLERKEKMYILD